MVITRRMHIKILDLSMSARSETGARQETSCNKTKLSLRVWQTLINPSASIVLEVAKKIILMTDSNF
jgi:hypothetical protein